MRSELETRAGVWSISISHWLTSLLFRRFLDICYNSFANVFVCLRAFASLESILFSLPSIHIFYALAYTYQLYVKFAHSIMRIKWERDNDRRDKQKKRKQQQKNGTDDKLMWKLEKLVVFLGAFLKHFDVLNKRFFFLHFLMTLICYTFFTSERCTSSLYHTRTQHIHTHSHLIAFIQRGDYFFCIEIKFHITRIKAVSTNWRVLTITHWDHDNDVNALPTSSSFVAVLTESMLCDNANDVIGTIWPIEFSMVVETVLQKKKQMNKMK